MSTTTPTPPLPDPIPTWARVAVYVFGAIVGASALAASGFDLYGLAIALGFVVGTALAVPIGLDAGAVVCGVRWITAAPGSPERARWRNATLALVGVSSVFNGLSVLAAAHWITEALRPIADVGLLAGPMAVAIAFVIAAAFPLVAAWMVHAILEVRDAAARHRAPKTARRRLVRLLMGAAVTWLRERAAEAGARRALADAQRALLLSPPAEEEDEESQDTGGTRQEDGAGDRKEPEPEPPALTGHKLRDARAWFLHEKRCGRTPNATAVNGRIKSDGYVKGHHIERWEREFAADPTIDPTGPTHLDVAR